jgi:ribonuclease Z
VTLRLVALFALLAIGVGSWMLTCAAWHFDEVAAGVHPLDPVEFEHLTVITLGTGGAYENHRRRGPSTAVALGGHIALVDAGRAVAESLRAAKIPVSQPDTILLTNLLPENTLGLDDLLVMAWTRGRTTPLRLLGPPGTEALARAVEASARHGALAWGRALGPESPPTFRVTEIADGWSEESDGSKVLAGALPGGPTSALAYRFEWRGRSAVVSATAWGPDELARFARGAHLLVHDGAMVPTPEQATEMGLEEDPDRLRAEAAIHTSLEQAAGVARRAGVETLVLVRLRPPPVYDLQITSIVGRRFDGHVAIADDGDEFRP